MEFQCDFSRGCWPQEELIPVYSPICKTAAPFYQEDDCIVNGPAGEDGKYPYASLLTCASFSVGATLRTRCSFESYGAPLLVISNDISKDKKGILRYGRHFEAVGYENGLNLWRIERAGENTVDNTNLTRWQFAVQPGTVLELAVTVLSDGFRISLDGNYKFIPAQQIPERFFAGITACEGRNRFYSFSVQE